MATHAARPRWNARSSVNHRLTNRLKLTVPYMVTFQMKEASKSEEKVMARSQDIDESIAGAVRRRDQSTQFDAKKTTGSLDSKRQGASRSAAKHLAYTCDTVAAEIQEAGQTVVNIANTIAAETEALADLLHNHGTTISNRVEEFMSLSDRVRDRMRAARNDVLGTSGTESSLSPETEPAELNEGSEV